MPQVHEKEDDKKHLAECNEKSDRGIEGAEIDESNAGGQQSQTDQAKKNDNIGFLRLDLL